MMSRNIIELIIEKKVDLMMTQNSADVYLMVLLKNLDFQTDVNTSYTRLEPYEDQEYLGKPSHYKIVLFHESSQGQ